MRIALVIILEILWFLGVVGTYAVGRGVDLLLVIVLVLLLSELRSEQVHGVSRDLQARMCDLPLTVNDSNSTARLFAIQLVGPTFRRMVRDRSLALSRAMTL